MHWVMASLVPDTVTALSVELGSISDATTTEAPVISRISFILDPPLPISDPHCEAGIIRRSVIGGRGMAVPRCQRTTNFLQNKIRNGINASCIVSRHGSNPRVQYLITQGLIHIQTWVVRERERRASTYGRNRRSKRRQERGFKRRHLSLWVPLVYN